MNNKPQDTADVDNELLNKYIDCVNNAESKITESFEKNLLTISTAALGVSITFLSAKSVSFNFTLLFCSWFCFGLTIVLTLCSYFLTLAGLNWNLERTTEYFRRKTDIYPDPKNNPFNLALYIMSYISVLFFILGLILTAIFIGSGVGNV